MVVIDWLSVGIRKNEFVFDVRVFGFPVGVISSFFSLYFIFFSFFFSGLSVRRSCGTMLRRS